MQNNQSIAFDRTAVRHALLYALVFLFAAHAFCFFNLTISGESVMINAKNARDSQISGGQYLQSVYWYVRGGLSAPLLVGMLSALYLALTAAAAAWLLGLVSPMHLIMLCGAMTVNAAVTSICAASLYTADAAFLSMLLAALAAVCCLRIRMGVLPAAALLACALALDPSSASFFAALTMIAMMNDLITERSPGAFLRAAVRMLTALFAGAAVYYAGYRVMLLLTGNAQHAALQACGTLPAAWLKPLQALFAPLNAYAGLHTVLRAMLLLLALGALILLTKRMDAVSAAMLLAGMLTLPLLCNLPVFSASSPAQITPAYCLLDAAVIMLLARAYEGRKRIVHAACAMLCVLFLGSAVFSNQVYLKINLQYESTLALMSRVIQRAEQTEGYQPGYTRVAIVGTPEESVYSVPRKGFEHLAALEAASANHALQSQDNTVWYVWEVLGYPFDLVSAYELEQIADSEAVRAMPAFPQEGCCSFAGDILVIKFSSSEPQ